MKKLLAVAAIAALVTGCKVDADLYNKAATVQQLEAECVRFGGALSTYRYGVTGVNNMPWTGNCIHPGTGNQFPVYGNGVRQ